MTQRIDQSEEQNDRKYNHPIRIIVFDIEIHAYVTVMTFNGSPPINIDITGALFTLGIQYEYTV